MTAKEATEWRRLNRKWAMQTASVKEMLRCMELNRKAEHEARERKAARA